MSEALIVGIISAVAAIIGSIISARATKNGVAQKLDTNQQIMNTEISHIKTEIGTMKNDIKTHNHYAQLFNENIPLIKEKILVANHRIEDLETDVRYYHHRGATTNTSTPQ
jgi:peptidoglycan hydrolase CwlO-like protein